MREICRNAIGILSAAALVVGLSVPANGLTFNFSGSPINEGDDQSFEPDVTIGFDFDDQCTSNCDLHITLTYNDSGGLSSIGEALSGVTFDVDGTFAVQTSGGRPVGQAIVDTTMAALVGAASNGTGDNTSFNDLTLTGTDLDVSPHWGYVHDAGLSNVMDSSGTRMLGEHLVGSVGDAGGAMTGVLGMPDMFAAGPSAVELNPPDGTSFSIVDPNMCSPGTCGPGAPDGFKDQQGNVWIKSEVTTWLTYDGSLLDITKVEPLFGTEGQPTFPIPEPGAAGLLLLGMLGLIAVGRPPR